MKVLTTLGEARQHLVLPVKAFDILRAMSLVEWPASRGYGTLATWMLATGVQSASGQDDQDTRL